MTVGALQKHIATLQARLLTCGSQLDPSQKKTVEGIIATLRNSIAQAELPRGLGLEELIEGALQKTQHIKAPDFSQLVGGARK